MSVVASCMSTAKYSEPSFGVGAELEQRRRQVEPVVDDGDGHAPSAPSPLVDLRIGAALDRALRTTASWPLRAANISGVKPPVGWSACSRSCERGDVRLARSGSRPPRAAPDHVGVAFGGGPHQRRLLLVGCRRRSARRRPRAADCTASMRPRRATRPSAASRRRDAPAWHSAPASTSACIIGASPVRLAWSSGVTPYLFGDVDLGAGGQQRAASSRRRSDRPPTAARSIRRAPGSLTLARLGNQRANCSQDRRRARPQPRGCPWRPVPREPAM